MTVPGLGMNSIFDSLFDPSGSMGPTEFIICIATALVLGTMISGIYLFKNKTSHSFALTVAMLPAIVCVVIMVVSGDIGAGIAVAGAFSLIRFRSAPGSAKEIVVIFLSMAVGLLIGMGFLAYAALFAAVISLVILVYSSFFSSVKEPSFERVLKITIPEDLNYNSDIESVIAEYTTAFELRNIKTVNMGSMFRLTYDIVMADLSKQKEFIDRLRVMNGNLEIAIARQSDKENVL